MRVYKNGKKVEMTYNEICKDLGDYMPDSHFVKVTTQGRISFTAGRPQEVRDLYGRVMAKGYMPSTALKDAVR